MKIFTCRTSQRRATASTIYTIVLHSGPRNVVITKPFYGSVFIRVMYFITFSKQTARLCHIPYIITFTPRHTAAVSNTQVVCSLPLRRQLYITDKPHRKTATCHTSSVSDVYPDTIISLEVIGLIFIYTPMLMDSLSAI